MRPAGRGRPPGVGATLADVARAAGVSASTASKVVRGVPGTSADLRRRVLRAVAELDYRPHPAGRALSTGTPVGAEPVTIAVPTLVSPYYRRLTSDLLRAARTSGLRSRVVQTDGSRDAEAALLGTSARLGAPLLLAPWHRHRPTAGRAAPVVPVVLLADFDACDGLDRVGVDSAGAADLCTTHLLRRGRRQLALLGAGGGGTHAGGALREQGFRAATRRYGVDVPPARTRLLPRWTAAHGAAATTALLHRGPAVDGIVAANDQAAAGVLHALRVLGRRVPDDVAVTGVDDVDEGDGALTSVALPVAELSEAAVRLLAERVAGFAGPARAQRFTGRLLVRSSSGGEPAPGGATA